MSASASIAGVTGPGVLEGGSKNVIGLQERLGVLFISTSANIFVAASEVKDTPLILQKINPFFLEFVRFVALSKIHDR